MQQRLSVQLRAIRWITLRIVFARMLYRLIPVRFFARRLRRRGKEFLGRDQGGGSVMQPEGGYDGNLVAKPSNMTVGCTDSSNYYIPAVISTLWIHLITQILPLLIRALCTRITIHGSLWKVVLETISWSNRKLPFHASNPTLLCSGCWECSVPTNWLLLSSKLAVSHREFLSWTE